MKVDLECPYCDHKFKADVDPSDFPDDGVIAGVSDWEDDFNCPGCRKDFPVELRLSIDVDEQEYDPEPEPEDEDEDELPDSFRR